MAVQMLKLKLLYTMQILLEQTDESHLLSAKDLCQKLEQYGINAERKSVYSDIETLQEFGMDIVPVKGANPGYYVGSRDFELPELKLLVDAVQSSKFITSKKTEELIGKLEQLTSVHEAKRLQRQVFIYNRPKTGNETIFYNVDQIHEAIYTNVQITFQYAEWTVKKELKLKKDGAFYTVSPWSLTWDDENYYLIAYDKQADQIKHYRVDKMQRTKTMDAVREGEEEFKSFDLAAFAKKTFGMYGGRDEVVTLRCRNSLAGVILDRFGRDVRMIPEGTDMFRVKVTVAISPQFFGWITGIGDGMNIAAPQQVREEYASYLSDIVAKYK